MSSVDDFVIANLARDLKDEVMTNVRSYASIANSPDNAKMAFGLMDKALHRIVVRRRSSFEFFLFLFLLTWSFFIGPSFEGSWS